MSYICMFILADHFVREAAATACRQQQHTASVRTSPPDRCRGDTCIHSNGTNLGRRKQRGPTLPPRSTAAVRSSVRVCVSVWRRSCKIGRLKHETIRFMPAACATGNQPGETKRERERKRATETEKETRGDEQAAVPHPSHLLLYQRLLRCLDY